MVVEDEARREGGLVLPASPYASPAGDARVRGWHCVRLGAGSRSSDGPSVAEGCRCIRGREERGCCKGGAVTGAVAGAAASECLLKPRGANTHDRRSMIDVQAAATAMRSVQWPMSRLEGCKQRLNKQRLNVASRIQDGTGNRSAQLLRGRDPHAVVRVGVQLAADGFSAFTFASAHHSGGADPGVAGAGGGLRAVGLESGPTLTLDNPPLGAFTCDSW